MYCQKCGKEMSDKIPFCTQCGNPLNKSSSQVKSEDYGLKKKLSLWNIQKVKNPELYGGYSKWGYRLLSLLSLGWIIGLILYLTNFKSKSVVKKYQAKSFALCAAIGFILMLLTIAGTGNEEKKNDVKGMAKIEVKSGDAGSIQNKYRAENGGWKFLKWGMTPDEVITIMKHYDSANTLKKLSAKDDLSYKPCPDLFAMLLDTVHGKQIWPYLDKLNFCTYEDAYGELYFYNNKLVGRDVKLNENDRKNCQYLVKQLEEQFKLKEGKITTAERFHRGGDQDFFYESETLVVFTSYDAWGSSGHVYYHNPKIVNYISAEYLKTKNQEEEMQKQKLNGKL